MITLPQSVAGIGVMQILIENDMKNPRGYNIVSVVAINGSDSNVIVHDQQYASMFTASEIAAAADRYNAVETLNAKKDHTAPDV